MLGNFLGDFVKGNVKEEFPQAIVDGIMNHRRIDHFTDSNTIVSFSKKLISRSRSRFSGIIVDIVYDHFLFRNWNRYAKTGPGEFIETIYKNLGNHEVNIPQTAEIVIEKMIKEDWLRSYGSMEGMDRTFKRISKRVRRENSLSTAVEELVEHYQDLNAHFNQFFPQLLNYCMSRKRIVPCFDRCPDRADSRGFWGEDVRV